MLSGRRPTLSMDCDMPPPEGAFGWPCCGCGWADGPATGTHTRPPRVLKSCPSHSLRSPDAPSFSGLPRNHLSWMSPGVVPLMSDKWEPLKPHSRMICRTSLASCLFSSRFKELTRPVWSTSPRGISTQPGGEGPSFSPSVVWCPGSILTPSSVLSLLAGSAAAAAFGGCGGRDGWLVVLFGTRGSCLATAGGALAGMLDGAAGGACLLPSIGRSTSSPLCIGWSSCGEGSASGGWRFSGGKTTPWCWWSVASGIAASSAADTRGVGGRTGGRTAAARRGGGRGGR
mmetsp:Transcript_5394/g.14892  ORF Transcript_5394/g.14892 Transcript_5394/m.14892 type:complete len:286 (-) Transcript_5394:222-1079(-)